MEPINRIERTFRDLTAQGKKIVKLFSGNPCEMGIKFPSDLLASSYRDYFETQDYKPHPKGLIQARQAISDYYERQGASVEPENVVLTSGTSESFFYLFSLLARPGDNVLTPNPAYPLFDPIGELTHVEMRPYHLREENNWSVDLKDLRRRCDEKTRALLLVSPHNPTGSVLSAEEIGEIVRFADERGLALICDEVFSEFYFGEGSFPRPLKVKGPLCFTLNGLSKMYALPAMKLSWIAVTGDKSRVDRAVDRLETIADTFLSCHLPIQKALPKIFEEGGAFLDSYRREVKERRDAAVSEVKGIPGVKFHPPRGGFYLMAEVMGHSGLSEEELVIALMKEEGIFVHPGYFYDYEKGIHFVFSFLHPIPVLENALRAIGRFLKRISPSS